MGALVEGGGNSDFGDFSGCVHLSWMGPEGLSTSFLGVLEAFSFLQKYDRSVHGIRAQM